MVHACTHHRQKRAVYMKGPVVLFLLFTDIWRDRHGMKWRGKYLGIFIVDANGDGMTYGD